MAEPIVLKDMDELRKVVSDMGGDPDSMYPISAPTFTSEPGDVITINCDISYSKMEKK